MVKIRIGIILFYIVSAVFPALCQAGLEIRGIYGSPNSFWSRGYDLSILGVNAVFVHSGAINHEMAEKLKSEKIKLFAEFAVLNGKNYVEAHPDAWPVNEKGQKVDEASWFMGVCPTNVQYRGFRMHQLRKLLQTFDLDGVWMDYVHWHAQFEEPEPILPETCFCSSCLSAFENRTGILVPGISTPEKAQWILANRESEWRDWRCRVIQSWMLEMNEILKKEKPGALLGLFHCPWEDDAFDGARRRILGIDYDMLKEVVEVFSPMVYHGRMGKAPGWVKQNIEWFNNRMKIEKGQFPKVWPIVQAYDDPVSVSSAEFETVLTGAIEAGVSGVMMFTSYAVAEKRDKIEVMKQIYLEKKK
jgi:hypothetical protein